MKIYERVYDNPNNKDGTKKPNKFLGDFEILETLFIGFYSSQRIGAKNGKIYLITEKEVSGFRNPERGGSRFNFRELKSLLPKNQEKDY